MTTTTQTTPEQARKVPCPVCQARAFDDCFTVLPPGAGQRKEFPHAERYAAYREATADPLPASMMRPADFSDLPMCAGEECDEVLPYGEPVVGWVIYHHEGGVIEYVCPSCHAREPGGAS